MDVSSVIYDQSKDLILASIKDHLNKVEDSRSKERSKLLDYYEGMNLERYINKFFDSDSLRQVPKVTQNITAKIIDSRGILYKNAPSRSNEAWEEKNGDLNSVMIKTERLTHLLGSVALRIDFDDELRYDPIVEFQPIFAPYNPEPIGIMYPLYNHGDKKHKPLWAVWTNESHFLCDQNGTKTSVNEGDVNPYGIIPVVFAHKYPSVGGEWWRTGALDVVSMNESVNVMLTELSLSMRLGALGQPTITGIDDATKLKMGADHPLLLPEGSSFDFKNPAGNLGAFIESIRFMVDSVTYNNNLKTKWSQGRDAISGEALRMLDLDLTESIMADVEQIWRPFEKELFNKGRIILSANGVQIPDGNGVDFSEPRIPLSPAEERAEWEWKWTNGLASKKDWFREFNPDATEEELSGMVQEVITEQVPAFRGLRGN